MYPQFGPYHVARLRVCRPFFAARGLEIVGLELFRKQLTYDWEPAPDDAPILRCDFNPGRGDTLRWLDVPKLLLRLKHAEPALVFVNGWSSRDALISHAYCYGMSKPRVVVCDSSDKDGIRPRYKDQCKSLISRGAAAAFVAGTPHADYLRRLGMKPDSIFLGCDAVDNAHFASASRRLRERGFRFLTVARLEPPKNLLRAAESFLQFLSQDTSGNPWAWEIVGYGSLEPILRDIGARSGGRITFSGRRTYDELPATYAGADLYWQPSIIEPWGLVVNEAMAAGLPVLVSDRCGCSDDLVDSNIGWTFDPLSPESMVTGLRNAAKNWDRWPEMGRAAQQKIAAWDLQRFAQGAYDAAAHAIEIERAGSHH